MSDRPFMKALFECTMTCGFLSSTAPSEERCNSCGAVDAKFGEFCSRCGAQDFSFVCPTCYADVVADHPDTVGPRQPWGGAA